MKWENNYDLSCKILKNPSLFTFPPSSKLITKENKDYSEKNKFLQLNSRDEIIPQSQKSDMASLSTKNFSFNFMRNTFIIVDLSEKSILVDFKPNRVKYIFTKLIKFIQDYFSYNFVSTITIIINHCCTTEILFPMSSDPNEIIKNINSKFFNSKENVKFGTRLGDRPPTKWSPGGYFSLYNSLEAIKELISNDETYTYDILIFNNSLLTYDNGVKNDLYYYFKEKFEINVISLEVPYDALKEITKNTRGKLLLVTKDEKNIYAYNTKSDIDEFLHNFSCKSCKNKISNIKIEKPLKLEEKNINEQQFNYFCFCHKKKQKIVYCCAKCGIPYCYIPFYCIKCNLINIDNTFLQLLLRAKTENISEEKNIKCFPFKFQYYYEQYVNDDMYIKNAQKATEELGKDYLKELQHITENQKIVDCPHNFYPLHYQFKLLYFYLKYGKRKNNLYSDIRKNVRENSYIDLIKNNKVTFLKDYMRCSGCDRVLIIRDKSDFDNIFIFSNCLDIFCLDCYKYLIKNNIGCLECND